MTDSKVDVSIFGGRYRNTGLDLRFHKSSEHLALRKIAKEVLHRLISSNLDDFEKSKNKSLRNNHDILQEHPNKCQNTGQDKKGIQLNGAQLAQI